MHAYEFHTRAIRRARGIDATRFALLDRFSDENETNYLDNAGQLLMSGTTPLFQEWVDAGNATETAADKAG